MYNSHIGAIKLYNHVYETCYNMSTLGNSNAWMATESRERMSSMVLANYSAIDHFLCMICMRYANYDQDVLWKVKLFPGIIRAIYKFCERVPGAYSPLDS